MSMVINLFPTFIPRLHEEKEDDIADESEEEGEQQHQVLPPNLESNDAEQVKHT